MNTTETGQTQRAPQAGQTQRATEEFCLFLAKTISNNRSNWYSQYLETRYLSKINEGKGWFWADSTDLAIIFGKKPITSLRRRDYPKTLRKNHKHTKYIVDNLGPWSSNTPETGQTKHTPNHHAQNLKSETRRVISLLVKATKRITMLEKRIVVLEKQVNILQRMSRSSTRPTSINP